MKELIKSLSSAVQSAPIETWSIPLNYNDQYYNKVKFGGAVTYETLRNMSRYYDVARICIAIKQAQITQLEWDIVDITNNKSTDEVEIEQRRDFVDKLNGDNLSIFIKKIIEDMLVLDGVCLYLTRTYAGNLLGIVPVDPATIKLRVDESGVVPDAPEIAYEQWIRGEKVAELDKTEMLYYITNPRTDNPYGFSVLESLLTNIESALKVGMFNMAYFTDGTLPEGFYDLPAEWNLDQIKSFQSWWDSMMAGDPRNMRKIKFMPSSQGGKGFQPAKSFDFHGMEPFMNWLLRVTCSAFGVMPQELGFTDTTIRSTSLEQTEITKRNSIKPLAKQIEQIINKILSNPIQLSNGTLLSPNPELKFKFMDLDPKDEALDAEIADLNIKGGRISIDDWRKDHGLAPLGVEPFVLTTQGIVLVSDIASGNIPSTNPPSSPPPPNEEETSKSSASEELRKWERKALSDLKDGKSFRKFDSGVLDTYTKINLAHDLQKCTDRDEIKELFKTWHQSIEEGITYDVTRLYKKLSSLTSED